MLLWLPCLRTITWRKQSLRSERVSCLARDLNLNLFWQKFLQTTSLPTRTEMSISSWLKTAWKEFRRLSSLNVKMLPRLTSKLCSNICTTLLTMTVCCLFQVRKLTSKPWLKYCLNKMISWTCFTPNTSMDSRKKASVITIKKGQSLVISSITSTSSNKN